MHRIKTLLTVIGALTVLILAGNTIAYAATGGKFVLGRTNKANAASTLKRTTSGAALNLTTKSSANAPLTTNGTGKIANLNADRLDGKDSSAFQSTVGALVWTNLTLGSGWSTCWTGTPQYAVRLGIAYFRGSFCGGSNGSLGFTIPALALAVRTGTFMYLPISQCNGAMGRLAIDLSDGESYVISDPDDAAAANCFVSLEGISYPIS